jgi:hypothetical protein
MATIDRAEVTRRQPESVGLYQRFVDWTLDHGGQIYGDERERQAWYEGAAVAITVQLLAAPTLFLAVALFCPVVAMPFVLALKFLVILPSLAMYVQAAAKKVDFTKINWFSAKALFILVLGGIPMFMGGLVVGVRLAKASKSVEAVERLAGQQGLAVIGLGTALMTLVFFSILAKRPAPDRGSSTAAIDDSAE